jgi:very-short-patch-repair endonuclease
MRARRSLWKKPAIVAVAVIGIGIWLLDVLGIAPGWTVKLTPLMIGFVILLMVVERRQPDSILVNRREKPTKVASRDDRSETYREIRWKGLIFRSYSEVKIARALDYSGVLFMSGCKVRLNTEHGRQSREVDFLVFHKGCWGILEVDGPYHSAEADHWRDTRFREHGFQVYRYDSKRCYEQPKQVVKEFLAELERAPLAVSNGSKEVFVVEFQESPVEE